MTTGKESLLEASLDAKSSCLQHVESRETAHQSPTNKQALNGACGS